jgi:hypothetical protein
MLLCFNASFHYFPARIIVNFKTEGVLPIKNDRLIFPSVSPEITTLVQGDADVTNIRFTGIH